MRDPLPYVPIDFGRRRYQLEERRRLLRGELKLRKKYAAAISLVNQHQGSLTEQLRELIQLANSAGLYDAADFLALRLKE